MAQMSKKAVFDQKSESGREGDFKSERRSQAGPKGHQLEVGPSEALDFYYLIMPQINLIVDCLIWQTFLD